jgi:capsule polysaccharide export protein KpsE/RkpR
MSVKPHSPIHDAPEHEQVILVHHGEEVSRVYDLDGRRRRDRTVAWLRLLWERRSFLSRVVIYGLILSAAVAFVIPSRFTSVARLMPPDNQSGSGLAMMAATLSATGSSGSGGGLGEIAGDLLGAKSTSDLFVGVVSSRTSEDALIEKFDLKKVYGVRLMQDARKTLADHTNVEVDRKTQIITISVTDRSPQRAAAMAQTYVEELNLLVSQLSTSAARRERIFLEGRLQSVNQDLEVAERTFSQFASKNTAIDVPEQGKAMVDAAAVLQGQLIAAESELEGLKQIYTDNNVRVRSLTARVAELRDQLNKVVGNDGTAPGAPEALGDSTYPSIRKLPLLGVTYADLYRQTKVQEAVFATLTQQYELAKVQEAKEIPTVKVLDAPDLPEHKSYPPRLAIILIGSFLALFVGVSMIFGGAMWESVDASDPGKIFAKEIYGTIEARLPWGASNGSSAAALSGDVASREIDPDNETR